MFDTPANNIPYLFAAFAIVWAVFFGFVFFAWRRHREIEQEVRALRKVLERGEEKGR
jgi:CcmD family protein